MSQSTRSLTEGHLGKQILLFSIPLMFSNILQVLFNMSDIAVVGRFAGSYALGSVGSTTTLVVLFTGFLIGMGNGVNVLVARHFGAQHDSDVEETVHTAAILCLAAGLLMLLLGFALSLPLLRLLGTKPELIDGALLYLRIYFLGMPALAIYNFGNGVLSAVGDTKRPLLYLSASGVVNIILNLFFVIVCKMDVAGVAIASVLSQYISAALILRCLLRSKACYALKLSSLHLTGEKVPRILSIGIPSGLQHAIFSIANLFIQAGVNSFDAIVVAGNAAAANADTLIYDVMAAFYTACSSFIGQNFGAGNRERIRKTYFICLGYSFGAGAVLGVSAALFGRVFLSLFSGDAAVLDAGMERLFVMGCSYALSALMDCSIAASRGLGKSLIPTIIVIMGSCVFRVIWIYTIFAQFHTISALYLLYPFSWVITAIAEILYFARCYKTTCPAPAAAQAEPNFS